MTLWTALVIVSHIDSTLLHYSMTQSIARRTRRQISSRKREFLKNIVKDKGLTRPTSSFDRL